MKQDIIFLQCKPYVFIPKKCSLSAFIDIIYSGETRKRHFKRLATFARYNVYSGLTDLLMIVNRDEIVEEYPEKHYIVRLVRYVELDPKFADVEYKDYYRFDYLMSIVFRLNQVLETKIRERQSSNMI